MSGSYLSKQTSLPHLPSLPVLIYSIFSELGRSWGEARRIESQANLQRTCGEKVEPFCGLDVYNVTLTIGRWKGRARREFTWQEFTRKEESELMAIGSLGHSGAGY